MGSGVTLESPAESCALDKGRDGAGAGGEPRDVLPTLPWMVTVAVAAEMEGSSHSCGH